MLGEVADRLRRSLNFDQLAARVGGDEFVIAAPDISVEDAELLAERIIQAVGVPIQIEDAVIRVGVSIGIATAPLDATTPDDLLRCADIALYRSKQEGRNTLSFFSAQLNDSLRTYRMLVEDMRRGLANGEFFLEYQPRCHTRTRRIQSVEALVRWNHPERGRVSPADFIPVAERSGLIVAIGEWVLRTACRQAAEWPAIGVSVNVSPIQFEVTDVVDLVSNVLREESIKPDRLELEITEGVLLQNAERALKELVALKQLGVRLAIDDFGTGFSSLSSLHNFPFDVIKIDRQFIIDLEIRKGGRAIVQAIIGLGKAMELDVMAEGVETEQQLAMLVDDGCLEVQGFLLGRPVLPEQISTLVNRIIDNTPALESL